MSAKHNNKKKDKTNIKTSIKENGISLRTIHIWLITGAIILSGLMLYSTFHLAATARKLPEISSRHLVLRKAALELMDASDYLTENVQRFTVEGNPKYMNDYFTEALTVNRREEAIATMTNQNANAAALKKLQAAMDGSMALMEREYYAMRLVIEAKNIQDYPKILRFVSLSREDTALSPSDKMRHATEMVLDDEYFKKKHQIRVAMKSSLEELERDAIAHDTAELRSLSDEMIFVRIMILVQIVGMLFLVWLTSHLGIRPILSAVEHIRKNKHISEKGAREFRYLVRAYNKMYDMYKRSLESLSFQASHDELTGAYNRSGYDSLLASLNLNTTFMILVDVDNFKSINDTYGHETGDRVLVKLVNVLKNHFRSDDFICRLGGDEFVILMVHTAPHQKKLIASKMENVRNELGNSGDGLPAISISVGIAHGKDARDAKEMLEKSDSAMYESKQKGKNTLTFDE